MKSKVQWATKVELPVYEELTFQLMELERNYEASCRMSGAWNRRFEYPWAITEAKLQSGNVVLDIGPGKSPFPLLLAEKVAEVHCVDVASLGALKVESERLGLGNIFFQRKNAVNMDYEDDFFDTSFCISVLEHTRNKYLDIASELIRVTNGTIIITVDVHERRLMTFEVLEQLLAFFDTEIPPVPENVLTKHNVKTACLKVVL